MADVTVEIDKCIGVCPFYKCGGDRVMYCNHPRWHPIKSSLEDGPHFREGESCYSREIISSLMKGNIPEKCPLRDREHTVTYKLKE